MSEQERFWFYVIVVGWGVMVCGVIMGALGKLFGWLAKERRDHAAQKEGPRQEQEG